MNLSRPSGGKQWANNNNWNNNNWRHRNRWRGNIWGGVGIGLGFGASYYYDAPYYAYAPGYNAYGYAQPDDDAVAYCMSRFQSYDPGTGTYLGYDGLQHPCP